MDKSMWDDLAIPAFLDRKQNGITTPKRTNQRYADKNGIIWPKKKNWRKIAERRRKAEGASLKGYTFTQRRGQ